MLQEIINIVRIINNTTLIKTINIIFYKSFQILLLITIIISFIYVIMTLWGALIKIFKKHKNETEHITKFPFVTIQIPTYNELAAINCAKKCLEFDYPKDKYEIIIGDDSKDQKVSEEIDKFAKLHDLIKVTRRGNNEGYKSGNLNHMLKFSKGEILIIFDSDYLPPKNFIKKIIQPFSDEKVAGVQARWDFINPTQNLISILALSIVSGIHYIVLPFIYKKRKISFLCGSAEAVRKDILIKLGGWKSGSLTEDVEYSLRLLKNKYKIVYLEDLKCKGELPYIAKDLYRQQMRWAYGVTNAFKTHEIDILTNKNINIKDKLAISFVGSGYLITALFVGLFITGIISLITSPVGPLAIIPFLSDIATNVILSSGILLTSVVAFIETKNYKYIPHLITSALTYGLVVLYYVNKGVIKALLKKPMQWHLVKKQSNILTQ